MVIKLAGLPQVRTFGGGWPVYIEHSFFLVSFVLFSSGDNIPFVNLD